MYRFLILLVSGIAGLAVNPAEDVIPMRFFNSTDTLGSTGNLTLVDSSTPASSLFNLSSSFRTTQTPDQDSLAKILWRERNPQKMFVPPPASEFHCDYNCFAIGLYDLQLVHCHNWRLTMNEVLNANCSYDGIAKMYLSEDGVVYSPTPVISSTETIADLGSSEVEKDEEGSGEKDQPKSGMLVRIMVPIMWLMYASI